MQILRSHFYVLYDFLRFNVLYVTTKSSVTPAFYIIAPSNRKNWGKKSTHLDLNQSKNEWDFEL